LCQDPHGLRAIEQVVVCFFSALMLFIVWQEGLWLVESSCTNLWRCVPAKICFLICWL